MPTWDELLTTMAKKLGPDAETVESLIDAGHLLTAAGYLKRKLGNDSLGEVLREAYGKNGKLPKSHKLLGELPFFAAFHTGYDGLIAAAFQHKEGGKPKVYSHSDGVVLRLADEMKHFVVMAHGSPDEPNKLVLNRLDYKRLISPNQAYRAFVEDLYRTRTILLVGFHANDPDFLLLLDRLVANFRDAVADHYAIMPDVAGPEAEEL